VDYCGDTGAWLNVLVKRSSEKQLLQISVQVAMDEMVNW